MLVLVGLVLEFGVQGSRFSGARRLGYESQHVDRPAPTKESDLLPRIVMSWSESESSSSESIFRQSGKFMLGVLGVFWSQLVWNTNATDQES